MKKNTKSTGSAEATKSVRAKEAAVAGPHKVQITRWQKSTLTRRHAYLVLTENCLHGQLLVDDHFGTGQRQLIAHLVGADLNTVITYRDDAIELPLDLQRAITEERLHLIAEDVLGGLLGTPDPDNTALKVVAWCDTLRHRYSGPEMRYLLEDLQEEGAELCVTDEASLAELRRLNAECEALWPERVDADA